VAFLEHAAQGLARTLQRRQYGTLVPADRRRDGHDEGIAGGEILLVRRKRQALRSRNLFGLGLERRITTLLELGDARRLDVEADRRITLAELDRERQPDVTQADHADPNVLEGSHERMLPKTKACGI